MTNTPNPLRVTADATAIFTFHLSRVGDEVKGLCGRRTETSDVPLAGYGTKRREHDRYCVRCARLAEGELRSAGVPVSLAPRDEAALRAEFSELCGAPVNSSKAMEVDWHEEYRVAALRARDRLCAHDTQELRDQIMDSVHADVPAIIFGSVFADDHDLAERCFAVFVHCREMRLF